MEKELLYQSSELHFLTYLDGLIQSLFALILDFIKLITHVTLGKAQRDSPPGKIQKSSKGWVLVMGISPYHPSHSSACGKVLPHNLHTLH
jgi:hypothetical protein